MKYSEVITLNFTFRKSINILFDKKNDYIETKTAKKALSALNYHNALALIGPFGSGKSAFLLYLENLIKEKKINLDYHIIKIVANNENFTNQLKESIQSIIDTNKHQTLFKILEQIKDKKILFLIDEFGKFLENDALEIQAFTEFINKNENIKLVVALHQSFTEYRKDFSKIQGRFENIIFKDDIEDSLKILQKLFVYNKKDTSLIKNAQKLISQVTNENIFLNIAPLHPFSTLAIIEVFNKFFQNHRSIFSFLFSYEKGGFSKFLEKEEGLYTLSELYDYLYYLLEIYDISLIDKEAYYLSIKRLNSDLSLIERDIIKAVSIIDIFKLNLELNEKQLYKAFIDRYTKEDIKTAINTLQSKNFITFLVNKNSFSLVEDVNIDLSKELNQKRAILNITPNDINKFFHKTYLAKEFFIEYGNKIFFEQSYKQEGDYKIIISDEIYKNEKSITIKTDLKKEFFDILKDIKALEEIKEEFFFSISNETKEIIEEMIEDKKEFINTLLDEILQNSTIVYMEKKYKYNYKTLQKLMSSIAKKFIFKTPKINNYTLIHTTSKQQNTSHMKKLFVAMLHNANKENLGIEKYPSHKALYLSVIKASGIHKNNQLGYPNRLNFEHIFEFFDKKLNEFTYVDSLVNELKKEPFCLNEMISSFLLSIYIIVNKEVISLFNEKGFIFELNEDILIHLIKNPKQYKLKKIKLTTKEKQLFKEYAKLILKQEEEYNKELLLTIIRELFKRFNALANYSKYTTFLSEKSKKLRSAFISQRDVFEALFISFPQSLGFDKEFDEKEYIKEFQKHFNEIVFSYKKMILDLEDYIKEVFFFEKRFPFDVSKFEVNEENKVYINAFLHADSIIELIDSLGILLVNKKSKDFLDNDVKLFKEKLTKIAKNILLQSKVDKNIAKITLVRNNKIIEEIVQVNSNQKIDKKFQELNDLSKKEKLLLAYKLIEETK